MSETVHVRIALVLNPRAGSISDPDALTDSIRDRCDELTVHAIDAAAEAAATAPDRLIVAGGDGSLGTAFAAAAKADLPLGVIPAGTANDFARALDLPLSIDEAVQLVTQPSPTLRTTWGGWIDDRPFVNVASVGLAVDAAVHAEDFKARLGPAAYLVGAARAGMVGDPVRATVTFEGHDTIEGAVWQVLVGASGRFGGGSGLGEADPTRPSLTAAWVPAGSRFTLPFRALGLRSRTIERQSGVEWWHAEHFNVAAAHGDKPAAWNVDGERVEPRSKLVDFRPLGPVAVIVPPDAGA
ncbi:MAG: hypothetical protein JHD16_11015 [Solirubrobacteraceae bacterium]|nr:hypothetical protein [Solirubrobacteraceae bacterium]